jgi:small-conductance mechanosensitive channel/flagellar motility protein MotE (MotC chaperone)
LIGLWIFLSWLVFLPFAQTAEQSKAAPPVSETKQASFVPVAIPAAEIAPRAQQALTRLQEMRSQIQADNTVKTVQEASLSFIERSDRWWESRAGTIAQTRSVQEINSALSDWAKGQDQIDQWEKEIAGKWQELAAAQREVEQLLATWKEIQAAGKNKVLPKAVVQKVAEVLKEATDSDVLIRNQTTALLKLQNQVSERRKVFADIRKRIGQARAALGQELFVLDSPPLWEALFSAGASTSLATGIRESGSRLYDGAKEFFKDYRKLLFFHGVLFLAVITVLYLMRRALTPDITAREDFSSAVQILARPFSSAFLFVLLLTPLLYPKAAIDLLWAVLVLTVLPVIGLASAVTPARWRRGTYLMVVLYFVEIVREVLPEDWLLRRLLLLAIAATALGSEVWLYRLWKDDIASLARKGRTVLFLLRLAAALLAVSIGANLVGNLSLAELLTSATIRSGYGALLMFIAAHLLTAVTTLGLQTHAARLSLSVREHGDLLTARFGKFIRLAAFVGWVTLSLYVFGLLGGVFTGGADFLTARWKIGATEVALQDLATFFLVFFVALLVSRTLRFLLAEEIFPRIRMPRGVPGALELLSRYGVLLLGFLLALAAAGVELSRLTLLFSALGVGVGFGLQNIVNNFVSGLILVFEHPVQVGDTIEVGALLGEVRQIGFRASIVRTVDGADVIIPNSELVGSRVVNWSLSRRQRRIQISVGIAFGTDPGRVIDILVDIARKHPEVLSVPAPEAVFDRFGDSALNFTLLCWARIDNFFRVRSELTVAVNNAFKEAGIQIPFPQRDLHVYGPDGRGAGSAPSEQAKDGVLAKSEPREESSPNPERFTNK